MAGTIEVLVPGGEANPGPPLGPELGPTPVDVQAVVQDQRSDRSIRRHRSARHRRLRRRRLVQHRSRRPADGGLIKDEAGFDTGSGEPQEDFVADLSVEQVKRIAEQKKPDLLAYDTKNAAKEVVGTCVTLGVTIEGVDAREFKQKVDAGEYDDVLADEAAA